MTPRLPYCPETYADALTWSPARREDHIRGGYAFLRTVDCRLTEADVQVVVRELRAIRYADADAPRCA